MDVRNRVQVNRPYSEHLVVRVQVHQDPVLSPLLFIHILYALLHVIHTGIP